MRTIHKFKIPIGSITPVPMRRGSKIVHVDAQSGTVCIWVLFDKDAPGEVRRFTAKGTGWDIEAGHSYVGTAQTFDEMVWHVFEIVGGKPE